jgi:pyruvate kinase
MKTKIISTIGPKSNHEFTLKAMLKEGMDIARINTKYGSLKQWSNIINIVRNKCEILIDIKGTKHIDTVIKLKPDYVAVSFAETGNQIMRLRKIFPKKIKIISKIETRRGIRNINNLIKASDGIMVARGDLGKNISLERVPIFQKIIINKCRINKKIGITATEMLLSMTNSRNPERAEVSDVANAVLDGSNALMLSEETSIGRYPIHAVKWMRKIINETKKMKKLLK